jgi:hypothetical protein
VLAALERHFAAIPGFGGGSAPDEEATDASWPDAD